MSHHDSSFFKSLTVLAGILGKRFGITVRLGDCACTNGKVITVPAFGDEGSLGKDEILGFLVHEAAHVRHTNFADTGRGGFLHGLVNGLEDARIERLMVDDYPGAKAILTKAHRPVVSSLQSKATDLPIEMAFPLYVCAQAGALLSFPELYGPLVTAVRSRLVAQLGLPLTDKVTAMLAHDVPLLQCTADCLELARRLMKLLKSAQRKAQKQKQQQQQAGDGQGSSDSGSETDNGSDAGSDSGNDSESESGSESASASAQSSSQGEEGAGQKAGSNSGSGSSSEGEEGDKGNSPTDAGNDLDRLVKLTVTAAAGKSTVSASPLDLSKPTATSAMEGDGEDEDDDEDEEPVPHFQIPMEKLGAYTPMLFNGRRKRSEASQRNDGARLLREARLSSAKARRALTGIITGKARVGAYTAASGRRLETSRLCRLALGNPRVFVRREEVTGIDTVVALLLDGSGSMGAGNMETALKAGLSIQQALWGLQGVKTGVSVFQGYDSGNSGWIIPIGERVEKHLPTIGSVRSDGGTPLADALISTAVEIVPRPEARKVIFVITDGYISDDVKAVARKLGDEVVLVGIRVGGGPDTAFEKAFRIKAALSDFSELDKTLFEISKQLLA